MHRSWIRWLSVAALAAGCAASTNRPAPTVAPRALEPRVEPAPQPQPAGAAEVGEALGTSGAPGVVAPSPPAGPGEPNAQAGRDAGAASPPNPSGTSAGPSGPETVVATVSGTRIELADLLGAWLRRDGAGVRGLLDDLVLSRIVELEAARLGVTLPAGLLGRAFEKRRDVLAAEAARAGATSLDAFIRARLGLAPAQFYAGLERELAVDLMAARVVRGWLLVAERAEVRVIAVAGDEARDRVQAKLAAGQAFADVARELSEDPSKEEGGRMTPVVRGESTLAQLAFAAPVGEVAGPIDERGKHLFLLVEARPRPASGPWDTLGPLVEASLVERGVEDPEYWQWQQAMQALYEVDLEPFRALLGSRP